MSESSLNNAPSKRPYWLKPMPMRDGRLSAYRKLKMKHSRLRLLGNPLWPVTLLLIVMALSGCQTQPIVPCVQPAIPTVPVSEWSPPTQTYSSSVQADLLKWEQRLTELAQKQ